MPEEIKVQPHQPEIEPDPDSGEPLAGSGFEDEAPDPKYDTGNTEAEAQ